jgi:hypothetical protein
MRRVLVSYISDILNISVTYIRYGVSVVQTHHIERLCHIKQICRVLGLQHFTEGIKYASGGDVPDFTLQVSGSNLSRDTRSLIQSIRANATIIL